MTDPSNLSGAAAPQKSLGPTRAQSLLQWLAFVLKLSVALGALYYVIVTKVIPNKTLDRQIVSIAIDHSLTVRDNEGREQVIHPDDQTEVYVAGKKAALADLKRDQSIRFEQKGGRVLSIEDPEAGLSRLTAMLTSPGILLAAIFAFSAQMLIGAQRLRMLLYPQGVNLSYPTALRLTYLGAFFDTFMLTSVGGDVIKAFYLARESPREHRVEAVSVLLLDRLMGLIGLLALALGVSIFELRELSANPNMKWIMTLLIVVPCLLLAGTAMLLSETIYLSAPMQFALRTLPMGGTLSRAYASLQRFRDRPGVLFKTFLMSLAVHCFGVLTGYVLVTGGHFDLEKGAGAFFVALLICNFVCSFAPFAGIGIGQTVYNPLFLMIAGMNFGWVLATVIQATILLAKAPGFIAWMMSRVTNAPGEELSPPGASGGSESNDAKLRLEVQLDSAPRT